MQLKYKNSIVASISAINSNGKCGPKLRELKPNLTFLIHLRKGCFSPTEPIGINLIFKKKSERNLCAEKLRHLQGSLYSKKEIYRKDLNAKLRKVFDL